MTPARWYRLTQAERDELAAHLDALLAAPKHHPDEAVFRDKLLELEKAVGSLRQHATRRDIRRTLILF